MFHGPYLHTYLCHKVNSVGREWCFQLGFSKKHIEKQKQTLTERYYNFCCVLYQFRNGHQRIDELISRNCHLWDILTGVWEESAIARVLSRGKYLVALIIQLPMLPCSYSEKFLNTFTSRSPSWCLSQRFYMWKPYKEGAYKDGAQFFHSLEWTSARFIYLLRGAFDIFYPVHFCCHQPPGKGIAKGSSEVEVVEPIYTVVN